jgi:Trypsin-like peptidase domain
MVRWRALAIVALSFAHVAMAPAQSAPTTNILTRITVVESEYGLATAFSIDVDGREYWMTAKHVLTGAQHPPYGSLTKKSASLRLLNPGVKDIEWLPVSFSVLDPGNDIDIAILAPPNPLLQSAPAVMGDPTFSHVTLGSACEFLGYPSASGVVWRGEWDNGKFQWMPFVKHCFISSLPDRQTKAVMLDGINNPGFSGGPVIYQTGPEQKIIAVISGIVTEPSEVLPSIVAKIPLESSPEHHKEKVNANSGFIVAYSIDPAVEAIRKNPIGPLRTATNQR